MTGALHLAATWMLLTLAAEPAPVVEPVEMPASAARVRQAVDGGVGFLTAEGVKWKNDKACASCHHAPWMMLGLGAARAAGYAVDQAVLADVTAWSLAVDNRAKVRVENNEANVQSLGSALTLIGAESIPELTADDRAGFALLLEHLAARQTEDGGWSGVEQGRPPLLGEPPAANLWSRLALATRQIPEEAISEAVKQSRSRADTFLSPPLPADASQQVHCLKVWLLARMQADAAQVSAAADALWAQQQPDGGWRQASDLASDAYATALAVYVLREAGTLADDPRLLRAATWLVNRQAADGSWPTPSRPMPDGRGPAGDLRPIVYTATGWATAALARCQDAGPAQVAGNP